MMPKLLKRSRPHLKTNSCALVREIPTTISQFNNKPPFYLSIAAMIKNESPYLEEWIEFHRLVGCQHFILYDNESTDNTADILRKYVESGIVTLVPWPRFVPTHSIQMLAYAHALSCMAGQTRWLAFIDADEFLFPINEDNLRTALVSFESEPAVAVYWSLFGTSGHETKPEGLVIENYIYRMPYPWEDDSVLHNRFGDTLFNIRRKVKSIVQPSRVMGTIGAHTFRTDRHPVLAVDGARNEIVKGKETNFTLQTFQLNHYISKSREEFDVRLKRGNIESASKKTSNELALSMIERRPIKDKEIFRFLDCLKGYEKKEAYTNT